MLDQPTDHNSKTHDYLSFQGSETSKTQFASSPNLSGWVARADLSTSKLKRFESVSTSNLGPKAIPGKTWKFSRIAPNLFKNKDSSLKGDKDGKSRVQSKFILIYS